MNKNKADKTPILLNCRRLVSPIETAQVRIENIIGENRNLDISSVVREGLFVLAIASFETMIIEILRYYLIYFFHKIDKLEFKISKAELLNGRKALIESEVDKKLMDVSYSNIRSIIEYFCITLSIDNDLFPDCTLEQLQEIKARRNLLLHNNLIVNNAYCEMAGEYSKDIRVGTKLEISQSYLADSLDLIGNLNDIIRTAIMDKYKSYTRVSAIKRLWDYLFDSPVMKFEDYWQIDFENDKIAAYKESKYESHLSKSELMFLAVLRAHFHGRGINIKIFSIYSLDTPHQQKMLFLLSILGDFRLA